MLKLIQVELCKYKRNKIIPAMTAMAVLFPCALTLMLSSRITGGSSTAELHAFFDSLFSNNLAYSFLLFLPGLIGTVGAVLFFHERDCGAFKNLRVIPVRQTQLILAKLAILFLWSMVYSLLTTLSLSLFCALVNPAIVYDLFFKLADGLLASVMITIVSLPAVVLVIYCNQNYLLSLLLAFSYSILNWLLLIFFASKEAVVKWLPLITGLFWSSGLLEKRSAFLRGTPPLTILPEDNIRVFVSACLLFFGSLFFMIRFYKKGTK